MTEMPPTQPSDGTEPEIVDDDTAVVLIQPADCGEPVPMEVKGVEIDEFLEVNKGASW